MMAGQNELRRFNPKPYAIKNTISQKFIHLCQFLRLMKILLKNIKQGLFHFGLRLCLARNQLKQSKQKHITHPHKQVNLGVICILIYATMAQLLFSSGIDKK